MKIQPINLNFDNKTNKNHVSNKTHLYTNKPDIVTFTNYQSSLAKAAITDIKTDAKAEEIFINLFNLIKNDNAVEKTPEFNILSEYLNTNGFRGLLHQLWTANPIEQFTKIVKTAELKELPLAKKGEKTIFELFCFGKNGFWNNMTDNPSATRDMKILFLDGLERTQNSFEFGMDKKGNITINQVNNSVSVFTKFYKETGNRKKKSIISPSFPETYHYKKNGENDLLKNFLLGVFAVPNF